MGDLNDDPGREQAFTGKTEIGSSRVFGLLPQAVAALRRYQATRQGEDLNQALEIGQEAVRQSRQDSQEQSRSLYILGNGLRERYNLTGDLADLERALQAWGQAIEQTPPGSLDRPDY